jgi:Tfp pilus assembly protein PilO
MNKKYTTLILALILIVVFTYFTNPTRKEVKELNIELTTLESRISESLERKSEERKVEITETDLEILEQTIPQGFDQEFLIKKITSIAEDNVTRINNISFNKTIGDTLSGIQTAQISLSGSTSEENFQNFLYYLENDSRTFIIKNLSMSTTQENESTRINFTLNIESYFS